MSTSVEQIELYGLSKKNRPKSLFSKVGIVGCGTMGQNIARMISSTGIEVVFLELTQEKIQQAYDELTRELDRMINHWGMTANEKRAILSRIKGTLDYADFKECDLVIDAILSKTREMSVSIRKEVFKNIEKHVSTECIIATNSSTLVITELSSELQHKERCLSLHFSSATSDAKIVEVAHGLHTTPEVSEKVLLFLKLINKTAIPIVESPGLISPRLIVALVAEACNVLMENISNRDDIDKTMREGFGLPLGPFELADKIGLDRVIRWMDNLYNEFGDIKYKAPPILRRLVRANQLGRNSGKGFYKYDSNGNKILGSKV